MPFTNADLLAIKSELTTNPKAFPDYLPLVAANDEANANALNLIRTACQVDRALIPSSEINKAINRAEFGAAAVGDRQWIAMITQGGSVDPRNGGEVRTGLLQIFASGSVTRANLIALLTESASRTAELFALGTLSTGPIVTPSDVANARSAS